MSDDNNGDTDNGDTTENQARIHMRTSAANGFDGNEVEITVEGGDGETTADIEDAARRRFRQAVDAAAADRTTHRQIQ